MGTLECSKLGLQGLASAAVGRSSALSVTWTVSIYFAKAISFQRGGFIDNTVPRYV
jgi:hypothetical protein